ncbi:unnamed protein product, partial [marine sediment metagenome]
GTYTTVKVDDENGNISASLTGSWDSAMIGHFTATGIGGLYSTGHVGELGYGTTAAINVSGALSVGEITFSGTAVRTEDDTITDDEVTGISGTITIQSGGSFVADLSGTVMFEVPVSVDLDITGTMEITSTVVMTASYPAPVIGISVSPASVSFGDVTPSIAAPGGNGERATVSCHHRRCRH